MKILFFIPTLSNGGAEKVLCNLTNVLTDFDNLDITVLTLFKDDKTKLSSRITYGYVFSKKFRGNVHILKLFSAKLLYKWMIARRGHFDIVVSYLQSPTMRIVGACPDKSVKTINWVHNEFHSLSKLTHLYRNETECRKSLRAFDRTVYVAESARKAMSQCLPEITGDKSYVIYNVNDFHNIIKLSQQSTENVNFGTDTFNIISVGRFTPQKAFDRLVRLIKYLREHSIKADLYLLGDGELRNSYIEEAIKLSVECNLHLLGFKSNPYKYVKKADLFVCSSIHEGYSTAVTEALVIGTPVVTTMCSGMEELLGTNGEYGVIVPNDEQALFEAVYNVVSNTLLYQDLKHKTVLRGRQLAEQDNVLPVMNLFKSLVQ